MKRQRQQTLILFCALISLLLLWALTRPQPPDAPRDLDVILTDLVSGNRTDASAARAELQRLGTNATPRLMAMYGRRPSRLGNRASQLMQRVFGLRASQPEQAEIRRRALLGFAALGTNAQAAIPLLMQELRSPPKAGRRPMPRPDYQIEFALAMIGEPAIPALAREIQTNSNPITVACAIEILGRMGSRAESAIPVLTNLLNSPHAGNAMTSLGEIGGEPDTIVPLLAICFSTGAPPAQLAAISAIERFGTNAHLARETLTTVATNYQPHLTIIAARALLKLGETNLALQGAELALGGLNQRDKHSAADVLLKLALPEAKQVELFYRLAEDRDPEMHWYALNLASALSQGPAANETVSGLILLFNTGKGATRSSVLDAFVHGLRHLTNPAPVVDSVFVQLTSREKRDFIQAMIQQGYVNRALIRSALKDEGNLTRIAAARATGALGQDARSLIPELVSALDDPDMDVRWEAIVALKNTGATDLPSFSTWPKNPAIEKKITNKAKTWAINSGVMTNLSTPKPEVVPVDSF